MFSFGFVLSSSEDFLWDTLPQACGGRSPAIGGDHSFFGISKTSRDATKGDRIATAGQRNRACGARVVLEKLMTAMMKRPWAGVAAILLGLSCASDAMPPVPHKMRGSIERIDGGRRGLVVTNASARVVLTWRETDRLDRTCLQTGDPIAVYYRKQSGGLVISDFSSAAACDRCN